MDHSVYAETAARADEIRRTMYESQGPSVPRSGYTAHLEERVEALEACLLSLLDGLQADGIITVVDP